MKRIKTMRIAAVLLVFVLLTTCVVSGTFAKYVTSGEATSNVQVAKWGVTVTATGGNNTTTVFDTDDSAEEDVYTIEGINEHIVLAPGTKVDLFSFTISGKPEVAFKLRYSINQFDGTEWKIGDEFYCPLKFTLTLGSTSEVIDTTECSSLADISEKIKAKIAVFNTANEKIGPNLAVDLSTKDLNLKLSVEWPFVGDDIKDTQLGNISTTQFISMSMNVTVEQID